MVSEPTNRPKYTAIWFFLRRYKILFSATLGLMVVSSFLESISVLAFFPLFTSVLTEPGENAGGILGVVERVVEMVPISNALVAASVLLVGVLVLKMFVILLRDGLIAYTTGKVFYGVKKDVLDRYASAHYLYMLEKRQGDLIFDNLNAPSGIVGVFTTLSAMAMSFFKILAIAIVLVSVLPWAALAAVGFGVIYYLFIHHLSKRISYRLGVLKTEAGSNELVIVNEFLSGFRQIVTLNTAKEWTNRFDVQNRTAAESMAKELAWNAVPRPIVELGVVIMMLGLILVLWFTGADGVSDTLPKAGVFAVAMVQLMAPVATIGQRRMALMASIPNLQRVYDAVTSDMPIRKEGNVVLESFREKISFENMSFAYPGRETLFSGLNLNLEKGKVTAIVGESGSGKTTIANFVLGLFEPTEGVITLDGLPIQDYTRASLLGKIGFVSQDPFTFHSTIGENILLGRTGRSQEAIVAAAKIANAHEFITDHPDGYDAIVGDRGMRLSGGQQQRLAIARAVLDNPEILIFDEATSSLDTVSERQVQEAIESVSNDRTVVIIAHRLSTIERADKIVVLENGQVVEEGSHEELLDKNGQYARLAAL